MQETLKIGTRGSKLALAQAHEVKNRLLAAHTSLSPDQIEIVVMSTKGDRILDRPLSEIGGKGLFTEEIEAGLLAGHLDLAVHSLKDMPTTLPNGLILSCVLERENPYDAFISPVADTLLTLPQGAVVGSASLRRQAQILYLRPDLKVITYRGNVQTRLQKLAAGDVAATFLAVAGLKRLGLEDRITTIMSETDMVPAVAQGAITIETREGDKPMATLLAPLNHRPTEICTTAERALLASLDGSCRTPIAALGKLQGDDLTLQARILSPDGRQMYETSRQGPAANAHAMGQEAGEELRQRAGPAFFEALKEL